MKKRLSTYSLGVWAASCVLLSSTVRAQSAENDSVTVVNQSAGPSQEAPFFRTNQRDAVAANSSISGATLAQTPTPNITNALYGRLQGLIVQQRSGEPGYDGAALSIRGLGTYDDGSLVVCVDGFLTTASYFQYLSPSEIQSVTVLKDPVTLASFGMKGANGVLWIVTKRGVAGKPRIQVNLLSGIQQALNINKPYGSYDYARLYNQAISNDGYSLTGNRYTWAPRYTDAQLQAYQNGTGINVDWYDQTLRKNGSYTNANVVFSGGNPTTKYALVLDYMKQNGLYNIAQTPSTSNAQIQRFNLRSNLDFSFFKIFEARVDLGGRIEDRYYPNFNGPQLWQNLSVYPANIYNVRDGATQNWSGTALFPNNPVASLNALGWINTHDRTLQANFNLKEKLDFITPGLYLSQAVSFNTWTRNSLGRTATYGRYNGDVRTTTDNTTDIVALGSSPTNQYDWKQVNLTAGYDRTLGQHAFSAALNYFRSSYILDWNINAPGQNTGNNIFYNFQNLGGRLHYGYKSTYLLELAFGYSGSDNFAPGKRWGFFPALAAGWVVSNEAFLKDNRHIDLLKLRLSAGQSGSDQTGQGRYLYQQYFFGNGTYFTGNNGLNNNTGIMPGYTANPDIAAERNMGYNLGIDLKLWKKLSLTTDLFLNNRSGIITQDNTLSALYGAIPPFRNLGRVANRGVELDLTYEDKAGDLTYSVGVLGLYAQNKVNERGEVPPVNAFSRITGNPIGTPIGAVADGFYDLTDFNADGSLRTGQPKPAFGPVQPGDIRYQDLDGNGVVDQNDVTVIGKPSLPSLTYAFHATARYRNIDLSVLFQGAGGRDIDLLTAANYQTIAFVDNTNVYPIAGNAWAYYPDQGIDTRATATYPRLTTRANPNNYRRSTFWLKDGSFLRLRNVEIGYTVPAPVLKKLRMETLRIYVNAVNPFTWSNLNRNYNIDPETTAGYPGLKSYNTGITLTF